VVAGRNDAADARRRAELEATAFGLGSSAEEAARAREALAELNQKQGRTPGAVISAAPAAPRAGTAPSDERVPGSDAPGSDASTEAPLEEASPKGDVPPDAAETPPIVDVVPVLASRRTFRFAVAAAGVAVIVVAAFLGGMSTGAVTAAAKATSAPMAAHRSDPSGDAEPNTTLSDLLAEPQTYADQLPGGLKAPVQLETTRLVFSNRSLEADDAETPWDVYAGLGGDASLICLIATPNQTTATEACYPRDAALTGDVVLVAQAASEILTLHVRDGIVSGTVIPAN
jgi:hypothetical protein